MSKLKLNQWCTYKYADGELYEDTYLKSQGKEDYADGFFMGGFGTSFSAQHCRMKPVTSSRKILWLDHCYDNNLRIDIEANKYESYKFEQNNRLLDEANRRYPMGSEYQDAEQLLTSECTVDKEAEFVSGNDIDMGRGYVYYQGKWATILNNVDTDTITIAESILADVKEKYPVGTIYEDISNLTGSNQKFTVHSGDNIKIFSDATNNIKIDITGKGFLYHKDKYAKIIAPKHTVTFKKGDIVTLVTGEFPLLKKGRIFTLGGSYYVPDSVKLMSCIPFVTNERLTGDAYTRDSEDYERYRMRHCTSAEKAYYFHEGGLISDVYVQDVLISGTGDKLEVENENDKKLTKAKKLYPLGTIFKAVTSDKQWTVLRDPVENVFRYKVMSTGSVYVTAKSKTTGYYAATCIYTKSKDKWAEIVAPKIEDVRPPEVKVPNRTEFETHSHVKHQVININKNNPSRRTVSFFVLPGMLIVVKRHDSGDHFYAVVRDVKHGVIYSEGHLRENPGNGDVIVSHDNANYISPFLHEDVISEIEEVKAHRRREWFEYCKRSRPIKFHDFFNSDNMTGGRDTGKTARLMHQRQVQEDEWRNQQQRRHYHGGMDHGIDPSRAGLIFHNPYTEKQSFKKDKVAKSDDKLKKDANGIEDISVLHEEEQDIIPDMSVISVNKVDLKL